MKKRQLFSAPTAPILFHPEMEFRITLNVYDSNSVKLVCIDYYGNKLNNHTELRLMEGDTPSPQCDVWEDESQTQFHTN